jgi:hypothetical protein
VPRRLTATLGPSRNPRTPLLHDEDTRSVGGERHANAEAPSPVGAVTVNGLRVARQPLSLSIAADGSLRTIDAPPELTVGPAQPAR